MKASNTYIHLDIQSPCNLLVFFPWVCLPDWSQFKFRFKFNIFDNHWQLQLFVASCTARDYLQWSLLDTVCMNVALGGKSHNKTCVQMWQWHSAIYRLEECLHLPTCLHHIHCSFGAPVIKKNEITLLTRTTSGLFRLNTSCEKVAPGRGDRSPFLCSLRPTVWCPTVASTFWISSDDILSK